MRIKGKVALVTGGGSGIGAASSHRLAEEGALVVVSDIDADAAKRVTDDIIACGFRAEARYQDVTDQEQWQNIVSGIIESHGHLDILVNNAGIALTGSIEDTTLEDWRLVNAVNSEAVFMGTQAAVAVMKGTGGSIINISSIEGLVGDPLIAAYNASKASVRMMTKSAALHCAESGYGIRINSVHPGFIETPMVANGVAAMGEENAQAFQERILNSIPMGAMGQPKDIANGVLFLASDESAYMTGSELVIDGGFTAH